MNNNETASLRSLLDDGLLSQLSNMVNVDDSVNIFDILRVADYEIRHSNMLAWLLDPSANHGLEHAVLQHLVVWYVDEFIENPAEMAELIQCDYGSFRVFRERDNIDLLLVSSQAGIVIAIENKVNASERRDQLSGYRKAVVRRYPDFRQYYIYLTIYGNEASEREVWKNLGYKNIIEWVKPLLSKPALRADAKQILEQYLAVLGRKFMEYSDEVVSLCQEIYQKHRGALDVISAICVDTPGFFEISDWCKEWVQKRRISCGYPQTGYLLFSTHVLERLFPQEESAKLPCYYITNSLSFPTHVSLEFNILALDKTLSKKLQKIKKQLNPKPLRDGQKWHKLKTWRLREYNSEQSNVFSDSADALKAELERIITKDISKFEAEMLKIVEN